jgi:phage tail sheath protein FI
MPEPSTPGIQIDEIPTSEQPIALSASSITAFVGRTLRGPVNVPVPIESFADFQQQFGGLWQPSPLSYAVEQFFEHGGRQAVIVRVVNGGMPPTLSLACGREKLTLAAIAPGSREFLRAAVDYDNIGDNEEDRFNLVVQRLRASGSERIDAQEIFRGLSVDPAGPRFVTTALLESELVRVQGRVPAARPQATLHQGGRTAVGQSLGYVGSNPDGNDGGPLTDYDVIGSAQHATGLFALNATRHLDFVHIPPLSRDDDIGPSSLVVASRYCRERRALLIVDPPARWGSADDAIRGLRELNFSSADACMFFPRLLVSDRLRGTAQVFGNGGAVAGMLARAEEQRPVWDTSAPESELLLRPGTRLSCVLSEPDRWRLAANGINALQSIRSSGPIRLVPRTLAGGSIAAADWGYIGARRFGLFLLNSIERSTRWVVTRHADHAAWARVRRQITAFLRDLNEAGAFPGAETGKAYFVITDQRINTEYETLLGMVNILVGFAASRPGEYHTHLITHSSTGSTIKPIAVNPLDRFWSPAEVPGADDVVIPFKVPAGGGLPSGVAG